MHLHLCLFALLATCTPALADSPTTWSGTSNIAFSGTSTLHDWAGKVPAKPFTARVTLDSAGQPTQVQSTVSVESARMDTAEPQRDENMRKAMQAPAHPLITATIDTPFAQIATAGKTPTRLPMTLTLLGKSHSIQATISHWKLTGDQAAFDLDFDLSMKACGISAPAVLFIIRVGDTVKVHASVTLTKS